MRAKSLSFFFAALVVLSVPPSQAVDRPVPSAYATRSEVYATHGMAATSQPLATEIALDVLRRGGTAVDAAIAANAALGLMEPTGSGIGGDLFAIVWDPKTKKLHGLNGSGRSPRSLTLEHFRKLGLTHIPERGPLPVSTPGCVDGWFTLHERFGRLPMSELLKPAIGYARHGFPVSEMIADGWQRGVEILHKWPGFSDIYMPGGRAPRKGEIFRNPALADTLEQIARGGRDAFYKGDIAKRIDAYMHEQGGFLSVEDLAAHHSEWVEPVSTQYRGYDVWELPPNSQGIATLQILNLLEPYDLKKMGFGTPEYVHLFVEAKKLAFEDRAHYYADPEFSKVPVATLISKEYARKRGKLIDLRHAAKEYPLDPAVLEQSDTIYLTVADGEGQMVSLIQSNYRGLGSGMTPGKLGFVLQDRGELFSLKDGHPNVYAPGKRPFQTIIPAFVTRGGKPWLSFGVMGGSMQPQGQAQVLINMIDFGMNLQEAGDAPRVQHDGSSEPTDEVMRDGGTVQVEPSLRALIKPLEALGHKVIIGKPVDMGGYQAIRRDENNVYAGASESRKDGYAAGY